MRILERLNLPFSVRNYDVRPEELGARHVADAIGIPVDQVYKTIVCRGDRTGVFFSVLAGDQELDLKAVAKLTGNRRVEVVPLKEVQPLTGYVRGGCTAIAAKKNYPVFVDESVNRHAEIAVSAGVRGTQIVLTPDDYVNVTHAITGPIAVRKREADGT
ncbi:MAG: aminoacyl-tRNA deacylase [Planctomycetia bacterium]|nr:aminoacyl-tRNA deacylase [Planctomycetia bacterium]